MIATPLDNPAIEAEAASVEDAMRRLFRYLGDAVEQLGGIEVAAGLCEMDRADLRRALDRAKSRYLRVEAVVAIGARIARYNPSLATKIGSALVEAIGLEVFPRVRLTEKEENVRMRAVILGLPHGEHILAETLGSKP